MEAGIISTKKIRWRLVGLILEVRTYYLSNDGDMITGWLKIDGQWYHFAQSGEMKTSWVKDKET